MRKWIIEDTITYIVYSKLNIREYKFMEKKVIIAIKQRCCYTNLYEHYING